MTEVVERLMSECTKLSIQERADLAYHLIHSLDEEPDEDTEQEWHEEVARRMEEIKAGRVIGIPAEQVFAELRERP